jgi:hypothetical protein
MGNFIESPCVAPLVLLLSSRGNSIGWGSRLMKQRSLVWILLPFLCEHIKKKKKAIEFTYFWTEISQQLTSFLGCPNFVKFREANRPESQSGWSWCVYWICFQLPPMTIYATGALPLWSPVLHLLRCRICPMEHHDTLLSYRYTLRILFTQ